MSLKQIRYAGGDERCGRRRVGLLNPLCGETHKKGMYLDRWTKQNVSNRKKRLAGKGRRRARPERRRNAKTSQNVARVRSRTGELNVATWNIRSLSLTGRRGAGHAEVLLQKCKVLGCDVIGLQETRRPGQTEFAAAGYRVFCSGVDGSTGRAGQHGVGLAVKESIIRGATWTQELTNERLMSMTFNLTGKSNAITFVVGYGPTDTVSNTREQKDMFWADLESAVSRVPSSDYLFVLKDANAKTGVRMGEDCKVIGAYGRDPRVSDSNGTSLLRFAGDNKLALVNTFFSVPKGCTSRTFNGTRPADRKRIDYIITRQSHRKHVRNVTVHLLQHADSDHNIVCARVRIPGRFARNRKQRAPTGRKSIDRRAITSDTDRRERLIQLVAIQLTQTELGGLGGTVGEKAALFTDTLLRSAEEVMPGQIRQSRISGLLGDEAMHDEFEEAWTEREEARKAVHGTLVAGGSAFRALRKACKKLRKIIQAAEYRYLEVFACELEEFIVAGDLRGWHGHLKGGWKLQGKKLRSAQYIRDENGKLLRKLDEIRARWRRYFTSLLNTTSATLNRTIIESLSQKPTALSLGDPPAVSETKKRP